MTLKQFCEKHGITATVKEADRNPLMDDGEMNHYRVTLKNKARGTRLTTPFSTGLAWTREPEATDVLSCLLSDANGADGDFVNWCRDLGYDTGSRKAEKIYNAVVKQTASLHQFFGSDYQEALSCEGE